MKRKSIVLLGLAFMGLSLGFTSCTDDDDNGATSTLANVMAVNATPGSTGMDFYINSELQNSGAISYGSNSAYYQSITGSRNLKLNQSQSAANFIDRDESLELNGNYSLFAMDTVGNVQSIFVEDDLSEPVLGKAHVRFVHASHNSPSIDIINLEDTSVLFSNMSFKQYSAFTPVDAGTYSLGYRLLGDSNIAALPNPVNLSNRQIYTVVASGYNTDTSGTAITSLNIQMINN